MFKKVVLLIISLIFITTMGVFAQLSGDYTSHDLFYRPGYGSSGVDEFNEFNDYLEIADQQIYDNKQNSFATIDTEAELESAIGDVTDFYTDNDFDIADYYTEDEADAADADTTYTAGTGLDLTGTVFSLDASAFDLNDFPADPDADRYLFWNDTTGALTWAEGSGSGVTTFVGLTDTPANYTDKAGYFPKVNAGATALEFAELTESDISDFGTYLTSESDPVFTASDVYSVTTADISNWNTAYGWGDWSGEGFITGVVWGDITGTLSNQSDLNTALGNKLENITGESIGDLSDVDLTDIADEKILQYNSTTSKWECETASAGGASELSDLSDVNTSTPTDKYVLVADGVDFESRQLSSDDLSDADDMAMLDENETITGIWSYMGTYTNFTRINDAATSPPAWKFRKGRDGDPTSAVSEGDYLGLIHFQGYTTLLGGYEDAAYIRTIVDGTPGEGDMPGRLEFLTSPDGSATPSLRMAIDNAGNIKMGDGAWTNYVNITNAGVLTLEGTANIEGVDATEMSILDGATVTTAELNILDTATLSASDLNIIDGISDSGSLTATELLYVDGVSSAIQTQLDAKVDDSLTTDLDMNEHNIQFDSTLTADHSYSGFTHSVTVGENVVFGEVLYLDATDTEWKKANAAGTDTYPGLVIALESKSDGQACLVLAMGYIRDDSWAWTLGDMLLLGETAGDMTATVPSDSGDIVQRLGYAIHADKIFFNPSIDTGEI